MSIGGRSGAGEPAPNHALPSPIQLSFVGSWGTGKTAVATEYARRLGQPVIVVGSRNQTDALDLWKLHGAVSAGIRAVASQGDLHLANVILPGITTYRWLSHPPPPYTPPAEEPEPDQCRVDDLYRLDHRTSFERKLRVDRVRSTASVAPSEPLLELAQMLGRRVTRVDRSMGATLADRHLEPQQLVQLFTRVLRRIAKTLGRLLSLSRGEPVESEPPGQLVTAHPHVTRGPTSSRAAMVLSAPREPMLV
jgi:hypothetical protein